MPSPDASESSSDASESSSVASESLSDVLHKLPSKDTFEMFDFYSKYLRTESGTPMEDLAKALELKKGEICILSTEKGVGLWCITSSQAEQRLTKSEFDAKMSRWAMDIDLDYSTVNRRSIQYKSTVYRFGPALLKPLASDQPVSKSFQGIYAVWLDQALNPLMKRVCTIKKKHADKQDEIPVICFSSPTRLSQVQRLLVQGSRFSYIPHDYPVKLKFYVKQQQLWRQYQP
jgi:hypothetical protein